MRSPRATDPAHASHDELLVARLAGGDDLDPREQAAASALVRTCPDCARLASDIVAISRAVATEPVPLRRRDFRISPEQARELRGSPLTRLMRRFTLPSDRRTLRPLATGALSIGLVLMFVGSVVPRPSAVGTGAPAAQREVDRAAPPAPSAVAQKVGELPASEPEQRDTIGGAESMAMDMTTPDGVAASPDSAGLTETAMDAAAPEVASRSVERAVVAPSPASAVAALADDQANAGAERPDTPATTVTDTGGRLGTDEGATDEEAPLVADDVDAAMEAASAGPDLGAVLVVIGVVLVVTGILLVLLLVSSRREPGTSRR